MGDLNLRETEREHWELIFSYEKQVSVVVMSKSVEDICSMVPVHFCVMVYYGEGYFAVEV